MSKLILGIWKSCVHKCDCEGVFLLLVWEEVVEQEELRERANKAIRRVSDVIGVFPTLLAVPTFRKQGKSRWRKKPGTASTLDADTLFGQLDHDRQLARVTSERINAV